MDRQKQQFSPSRLQKARGSMSVEKLARAINVSSQAVRNWESGENVPSVDKLVAIAAFLGRPFDYFIQSATDPLLPAAPIRRNGNGRKEKVAR